jgi:XTP/dITP diphosphohydrolase
MPGMIHKPNKTPLVFATNNQHKLEEIRDILKNHFEIKSLQEIGCFEEIPEEQDTLEGNAAQKASFIYSKYKFDCFADDTGLEIDALNGEPGVYSARYAGEGCSFENNMNLVLKRMEGIVNRKARFRTVIALIESGSLKTFEGIIQGSLTNQKIGNGGFGYDPVFKPEGFNRTFAEMSASEKNSISHRAIAVKAFAEYFLNTELPAR